MDSLRIRRAGHTLVDQVEEKLIEYFKEQGLRPGDGIPNETTLAESLGIGRTVLREALSRFKMTGMIESRTKRGMTLAEPSILCSLSRCINPLLMTEQTLIDLLEFRIALELGSSHSIFANIKPQHLKQLEKAVRVEESGKMQYYYSEDCQFHSILHKMTGNKMIVEFLETIRPALEYIGTENTAVFESLVKEIEDEGKIITHRMLFDLIRSGDEEGYRAAMDTHFLIYRRFIAQRKTQT